MNDFEIFSIMPKHVLVIGDLMLDRYYRGDVQRISPEAPIPVLVHKDTHDILGGAANVASNLIAAHQKVSVASVIGDDAAGDIICTMLAQIGVNTNGILRSSNRITTVKARYVSANQQLLRVDDEKLSPITAGEISKIENYLHSIIDNLDAIIISDYAKGVITSDLCDVVKKVAQQHDIKIFFDVKQNNLKQYSNSYLVKPNKKELEMLYGRRIKTDNELREAMRTVKALINCNKLMVTLGSDGMLMLNDTNKFLTVKEDVKNVYDVVGAGDTSLAYIVTGLINGWNDYNALLLANRAASIKVSKMGTYPVSLHDMIYAYSPSSNVKIVPESYFVNNTEWRDGKKIVFTNGCFDILHVGHLNYLQKAKKLGDVLIVAVNSDHSVKRIKGASRPINNECDRMELLAGLSCVDYVVKFDEDTPLHIINIIQPDILVKGGDYIGKEVVGREQVEQNGGMVQFIDYVDGKSTTDIINKICSIL